MSINSLPSPPLSLQMEVNHQLPDDGGAYRKYAALLMSWLSVTDDFMHKDCLRRTRLRKVMSFVWLDVVCLP